MRADGGDGILFYIIIAIIGVILSYLQNKSRPKQPEKTEIPEPNEGEIWKDFMDWDDPKPEPVFSEKKESSPAFNIPEIPQPEIAFNPKEEGKSVFDNINVKHAYESISYQDNQVDFIKETEITSHKESEEKGESFNFSLREAILYSEILNRKYI